jgi:hypothetical protein
MVSFVGKRIPAGFFEFQKMRSKIRFISVRSDTSALPNGWVYPDDRIGFFLNISDLFLEGIIR